jgi:anti-sigma-K factor RskA
VTTREKLTCESVQALAGAFALNAVTPDEATAIREHVRTCADCRSEVAEMIEVATLMSLAAEPVPPPAGLKQRIMSAVAAEAADSGIVSLPGAMEARQRREDDEAGAPAVSLPAGGGATARRSFWTSRAWPAAAAAALVAAIGLGGYAYNLQQTQPRVYSLHLGVTPQATGTLVYVPRDHTAIVTVDGVPDPGGSRTYQMWLIRDGRPESVGTMRPDAGGKADVTLSRDLSGYQEFAITVEPTGGSPQPTGAKILAQPL